MEWAIFTFNHESMIKAVIFDLDGTLVQTEVLKAQSYARAINELTANTVSEGEVMTVFSKYVGLSRTEVVSGLGKEFKDQLTEHIGSADSAVLNELIINRRLSIYRNMISDADLLSGHFCPYSLGLFHRVKEEGLKVVLATMSHLPEAKRIVTIMGIYDQFDLVLTRDDVKEGKPDPEIYLLASQKLGLSKDECLVIEDSVNGIRAGLNAGMHVFAVTNDVTRQSVHDCELLEPEFIVDDLNELVDRVGQFIMKNEE